MNPLETRRGAPGNGNSLAELNDYAAASRLQAEDAEARGNLPLARELNARADEAEVLGRAGR